MSSEDLTAKLDGVIAYYKVAAADGWTVAEVYSVITRAVATLLKLLTAPDAVAPAELKAVVLAAFDKLYDEVMAPIDIPYVPDVIETRFVDPILKVALRDQVAGILDALLKIFEREAVPPPVTGPAGAAAVVPY